MHRMTVGGHVSHIKQKADSSKQERLLLLSFPTEQIRAIRLNQR